LPTPARADWWLAGYFDQAFEIRGDRSGGVDAGLRCGFGRHEATTIAYPITWVVIGEGCPLRQLR
jgi:hypothetical protein